ncbi:MAG: DnaJ-like protein (Heat shock protein) [Marinobacter sp. T13-3]|jgi:DnaJ like chaperone protein|nr:MAG: DnaJ-like protein (Heat shock protein) [Marinobacter sp. T13-3]
MSDKQEQSLPAAMEAALSGVLRKLGEANHKADTLLRKTGLPRRYHKPLFFFLGHIAKGDGRVTEADIQYAERLIKALGLSSRQRRKAIEQFQLGKNTTQLPMHRGLLLRLQANLAPGSAIITATCLCHGAQIQGQPGKARRYRCEDSITCMGLPVAIADEVFESYASKVWAQNSTAMHRPTTYADACLILGVTRRDTLDTIKRQYRKKVSACHPDKLAQQKLTPTEKALAKDQLLRYQQAWELIKKRHRVT